MNRNLTVTLSSVGNPDYHQGSGKYDFRGSLYIDETIVKINSLQEASKVCRDFIEENDLGGGNWSGGKVYENGLQIARISYNGRIWDMEDKEIK